MNGALLLAIFWAAVYLGNKIDELKEDLKKQQTIIYKDLSTGVCYLIDETKKRSENHD